LCADKDGKPSAAQFETRNVRYSANKLREKALIYGRALNGASCADDPAGIDTSLSARTSQVYMSKLRLLALCQGAAPGNDLWRARFRINVWLPLR